MHDKPDPTRRMLLSAVAGLTLAGNGQRLAGWRQCEVEPSKYL